MRDIEQRITELETAMQCLCAIIWHKELGESENVDKYMLYLVGLLQIFQSERPKPIVGREIKH